MNVIVEIEDALILLKTYQNILNQAIQTKDYDTVVEVSEKITKIAYLLQIQK
jgi:hypothetical protein